MKSNPSQKGVVHLVLPMQGGNQFYEIVFDGNETSVKAEHEVVEEVVIRSPWDLLANNGSTDYRNLTISSTVHKVKNTSSNTISTLKASRTIFKPYQYKPLVKFLQSSNKRILIADEVGLGKTIEAGHILLEFAARGYLKNALIICTNSLREKWQRELQNKFSLSFKVYDKRKELIRDIKDEANGGRKSIFGIINYEKLRPNPLPGDISISDIIEETGYRFDFVICDEAHKVRNSETQQHQGLRRLLSSADASVFLTATPIMTNLKNLHSLVKLLEPNRYSSYNVFRNDVESNRPFIRALAQLNSGMPFKEVAESLHNETLSVEHTADDVVFLRLNKKVSEKFKDDKLYQRARKRLLEGTEDKYNLVRIQNDLMELNSLNHMYTRTRKKEVIGGDEIVKREPRTIRVKLTEKERAAYDQVVSTYEDDPEMILALIQKKRLISSCLPAYYLSKEQVLNGEFDLNDEDSKFKLFRELIDTVVIKEGKKLIVFSFFTKTLLYLKAKLDALSIRNELIYGEVSGEERVERLDRFKENAEIKVFLSSEVGSEGLDMQFCDALVNYDLPWNPMVVEQRIGRIDRVGQQSPVINIYNLVLADTIEDKIVTRLYERINLFKESIGDMEEILGETTLTDGRDIEGSIEELYRTELSQEEIDKRLNQIVEVIERTKLHKEQLAKDLDSSFANDMHFNEQIRSITENKKYLTSTEILKYIESIFRIELSDLKLEVDNKEQMGRIIIPAHSKNRLFDFIDRYKDHKRENPELDDLYRKFKKDHFQADEIEFTIDQQKAFERKTLEYISAFHPLVNAITNYFLEHSFDKNLSHKAAISKEFLSQERREEGKFSEGYYILVIYRISVLKDDGIRDEPSINHLIHTALFDLNTDDLENMGQEESDSDHLFAQLQEHAEQLLDDINPDKEFVDAIRPSVMMRIKAKEDEVKEDEELKFFSDINRIAEQNIDVLERRRDRLEGQIEVGSKIEPVQRKNLATLENEIQNIRTRMNQARIEVSNSIISVNLIQIK